MLTIIINNYLIELFILRPVGDKIRRVYISMGINPYKHKRNPCIERIEYRDKSNFKL